MALRSRNKVSADFNMSSMTDIVFLLLIFFMLTSTLVSPNALKLLLPSSKARTLEKQTVSVSITKDIDFFINAEGYTGTDYDYKGAAGEKFNIFGYTEKF